MLGSLDRSRCAARVSLRPVAGQPVNGGLPEWSKGAVCKTAGSAYVGSNPTPATNGYSPLFGALLTNPWVGSTVDNQPSRYGKGSDGRPRRALMDPETHHGCLDGWHPQRVAQHRPPR